MRRLAAVPDTVPAGLLARAALREAWRWDRDLLVPSARRIILPGRDRLIVPLHAAVSVVSGPTAFTPSGSAVSIDATGADYLIVGSSAFDGGFATGRAVPTTGTYNSVNGTQLYTVSGGTGIPDSFTVYGWNGLASGSHDLVWNLPGSGYDGGPTCFWMLLAGVNQGAGPLDGIRTPVQDNTLGTSTSIAAPSGNQASDYPFVLLRDFTDTTATLSGCTQLGVFTVNSETLRPCVATSTSSAAGQTGGSNCSGVRIHFIQAAAGGAGNPWYYYRQQ